MGSDRERIATCCCGGFSATAREEPAHVYACSCLACQRGSGSAFSYAAIYPEDAVTVAGRASYYLNAAIPDGSPRARSVLCAA
jgi:hypothetical protein